MARGNAVWGIDIGQCALKALKCYENDGKIVAEAFDYIEYPQILSQPEASPDELIADALAQFLKRNKVKGCKIAIAVSGQAGLARFVELPPVDASQLARMVHYEAEQNIPFDLETVVWDHQRLGVGASDATDAFLATEVGIFAIKREVVKNSLHPFVEKGVDVDIVQLAPMAIYNMMVFDRMPNLPTADAFDPDNPPNTDVAISFGTDSVDMVFTNGFSIWQRNIPIGGNHFTRGLTNDLKLTFAKAEHLKKHAAQAQDPKAVFQAMGGAFRNLQNELEGSLRFFANKKREVKIGNFHGMGGTINLLGMKEFLAKNFGKKVYALEGFRNLTGKDVIKDPAFRDNVASFGVAYGLTIQALGLSELRINLMPKEFVVERMVRQKKPWAAAAVALLLLAFTINFSAWYGSWKKVEVKNRELGWSSAMAAADSVNQEKQKFESDIKKEEEKCNEAKEESDLVGFGEDRKTTLTDLYSVLDQLFPKDTRTVDDYVKAGRDPLTDRSTLWIDRVEMQRIYDLLLWQEAMNIGYKDYKVGISDLNKPLEEKEGKSSDASDDGGRSSRSRNSGSSSRSRSRSKDEKKDEEAQAGTLYGPHTGWVVQIRGHHYNLNSSNMAHVRRQLINTVNTKERLVFLPRAGGLLEPLTLDMFGFFACYGPLEKPQSGEEMVKLDDLLRETGLQEEPPLHIKEKYKEEYKRRHFTMHLGWQPRPFSQQVELEKKMVDQSGLKDFQKDYAKEKLEDRNARALWLKRLGLAQLSTIAAMTSRAKSNGGTYVQYVIKDAGTQKDPSKDRNTER